MWTCSCGEQIENQFDACWRCAGKAAGVKDPDPPVIKCPRCEVSLDYRGTKRFHEGGYIADALGFVFHENLDLYSCSRCGHVEFFLANIGRDLRSREADFATVPSSDELTPPSGSAGKGHRSSGQNWTVLPSTPQVSADDEE